MGSGAASPSAGAALHRVVTRVRSAVPELSIEVAARAAESIAPSSGGDETVWHRVEDRFTPPVLEASAARIEPLYGTDAPATVASVVLQNYQWPVLATMLAAWVVDEQAIVLGVDQISITVGNSGTNDGKTGRIRIHEARIGPGECRAVGEAIEAHFEWVIARLSAHFEVSDRRLWLDVIDRVTNTVVWLMQTRDPAVAASTVQQVLDPLLPDPDGVGQHRKARAVPADPVDGRPIRRRVTCCHVYRVQDGAYCSTCPYRAR